MLVLKAVSLLIVLKKKSDGRFGYNADTDEFIADLISAGIVDPAKVTRTALQNAASIGSLMLTTEAVIADHPEEEKSGGGAPGGMPGGDMGGMGGMGGMDF